MTREKMLSAISEKIKDGEEIKIRVAHRGKWNGADIYTVTHNEYKYFGHEWNTTGDLIYYYQKLVLNKEFN